MANETAVLDELNGRLPVPARLAIHAADRMLPHACVIYELGPALADALADRLRRVNVRT
jgi:hypothetical protein